MLRPQLDRGWTAVAALAVILAACSPSAGSSASRAPEPSAQASPGDTGEASPLGSGSGGGSGGEAGLTSDPLHTVELFDVNSDTVFTLGELAVDGPVLLETMAIWCTNCRAQQHEVVAAHELATFHSVSLDIDPNERPGDLADYSVAMGFSWRFAMANQALASALRDRFGAAVLNPPSTPMILLFPDGSVRALEFRGHSAEELAAEIAAG